MVLQAFVILVTPAGTWQRPRIAKVTVKSILRDSQNALMDEVVVLEEGEARSLNLLKEECTELQLEEELWILDHYFHSATRPAQSPLTLWRLVLDFPEPLLLLALWGIWRLRRSQAKEAQEAPTRERIVLRDDFHTRAERFAKPKGPGIE
jgi:hypothetical protein